MVEEDLGKRNSRLKCNIKVALKETGRIWVDSTDSGHRPVVSYCTTQEIINFPCGYATELICVKREREREKINKKQQSDVYYQLLSQHVSDIIMPMFRRTKTVLLHLVYCSGSAGCGW
jgi:predicted secreted protein